MFYRVILRFFLQDPTASILHHNLLSLGMEPVLGVLFGLYAIKRALAAASERQGSVRQILPSRLPSALLWRGHVGLMIGGINTMAKTFCNDDCIYFRFFTVQINMEFIWAYYCYGNVYFNNLYTCMVL